MSLFRFPFNWGSVPASATTTEEAEAAAVVPRWTALAATATNWIQGAGAVTIHRFERIYVQPTSTFGQSVNFAFQIQSQFPFYIATGNEIFLSSTITNP